MLTHAKQKTRQVWKLSKRKVGDVMRGGKYLTFRGSKKKFIENGACILEESISLFHRTISIRYFSVNDINNMKVERIPCRLGRGGERHYYKGCWEGRVVLVQHCSRIDYYKEKELFLREIAVGSMIQTHNNARKMIGCCIETEIVVIVYEWESSSKTLYDCLNVLNWEERLRIAWEISHVVAYLHTAFPRPIVHRDLTHDSVYLCKDNSAKLGEFSCCISIPEGEEFVEEIVMGTVSYLDPEYLKTYRVAERSDVYSFGMLFLVLLTGNKPVFTKDGEKLLLKRWVRNGIKDNSIHNILDPVIIRNGVTPIEELQLTTSIHLALLCTDDKGDRRPSMVEVATQLHNWIRSPQSIPVFTTFQDANSSPKARSSLTDDIKMEGDNDDDDDMGRIGESSNKGIMSELPTSVITCIKDSSQSSIINETSTPEPSIVAQLQRQLELNTSELLKTKQALSDALQQLDELKTKGDKNKG